jgi:hypothetical protein
MPNGRAVPVLSVASKIQKIENIRARDYLR